MKKIIIYVLFILVLLLISCSSSKEISPKEAYEMMNKGDCTLVDLSKPTKYRDGHIKNAILIEFHPNTFKKEISAIDRSKPIIIYCGTGKKTAKAVSVMKDLGFKGFYIISGGLRAWKEAGFQVVK